MRELTTIIKRVLKSCFAVREGKAEQRKGDGIKGEEKIIVGIRTTFVVGRSKP